MLTLGVCVLFVLQMVDMVVSMMVSFPKGASWNLRNIYGSPGLTRHDIWQAALKTWNLQVPCEDILAEYYGHFKFGVKPVQCHSVFCRLVTKFHKLIGCHGQQVFDFQINLFLMSNTNNLCRRIDKQSVQAKCDLCVPHTGIHMIQAIPSRIHKILWIEACLTVLCWSSHHAINVTCIAGSEMRARY